MGHWIAGWGPVGFAADHVALFADEGSARVFQVQMLAKLPPHAKKGQKRALALQCHIAIEEIDEGHPWTVRVDGKRHFVAECKDASCPWPEKQCTFAQQANAGAIEALLQDLGQCRWFALCDREATTTLPHPVLGRVPTCHRCADKINRLDDQVRRP